MKSNNTTDNQEKKEITWGGLFNEFFWICSGANRKILRQCPTEYSKYFGIGGTIFFTAVMAMLSGGYAFYTIFNSTPIAILFGVFWGLLIFNLDRFIVNTMYSDGKYTISKQELLAGTPRLIIALFLGIVISTPLEMKIFEDRINSQIVKDNARRTEETAAIKNVDNIRLDSLNRQYNALLAERDALNNKLLKADEELKKEGEGTALSGKVGHGPIYKDKEDYRNSCKTALEDWAIQHKFQLEQLEKDIKNGSTNLGKFDNDITKGLEENGFCVRYEAFSNVKKEVPAARIVSIFIMLMFIIIEIAPTFFKMMIASGPYDELLREEMERKKAESILHVSQINADANTQIQISIAKNKDRLEAEIAANKAIMSKIASAQAELLDSAIKEWRKAELAKIKENPSLYIKTNTKKA